MFLAVCCRNSANPTGRSRWAWSACASPVAASFSLLSLTPLSVLLLAADDPAVESGRQALDEWWWRSYPWYDKAADAAQPIDVSEPWYMRLKFWDRIHWPNWQWPWSWPRFPTSLLEWAAWIGIALVLAALVYLIVRAYRMRSRDGEKRRVQSAGSDAAEDRRRVEALPSPSGARWPSDVLAEAARLYHEGNYRQAIIYLFGHELIELDKHHLIRLAKGKTNRQYVRELGRRQPLCSLVQETMVTFEDAFFGNYAIDRGRFESCWSRLDEFDAAVAEGAT